jgi:flagellar assembly protein FliH
MQARAQLVEIFEYPAAPEPPTPCWDGVASISSATDTVAPRSPSRTRPKGALDAEIHAMEIEESRRIFAAGRERGLEEGRQAEREWHAAAFAAGEKRRAEQVAVWIAEFAQERERYLQAVEHEVVELALAVAARILRREAQMDPLLLTGAVRVALGQLSSSTEVLLRVPAEELELWTEAIAHVPNLTVRPTVVAGEGMRLGECALETKLGSVDLGIRAQLGEIERGFFDRTRSKDSAAGNAKHANPPALEATQ